MNRRGTEPYARWCGRTEGAIPPPTRLETFVDRSRFRGICYQAANWIYTGHTQGRTRNDRDHSTHVSIKDVYVYPLSQQFRRELCHDNT